MDRYRPRYHFTSYRNWINDPNGPFVWNGEYHLFYQHNPSGKEWGDIHWGHAKSGDLVNWSRLPVALAPSRELGELHCYSGCAVPSDGEITLFYTSVGEGERNASTGAQQWIASSRDGTVWRKPSANPLLTEEIHGELRITEWRDPYVWKEPGGNEWHMLLGGTLEGRGCALIYHSADLGHWRFGGIYHRSEAALCECPHLFRFGDRALLLYSPNGPVQYVSGLWDAGGLTEELARGTVDYGGWEGFYASTGFVDEGGRRILLGWMPEGRGDGFPVPLEWTGALALPRLVDLKADGTLSVVPIPEIETLRGERASFANVRVGSAPFDAGVRSSSFECALEIERPAVGGELAVSVLASPCGRERTEVRLDFTAGTIAIDRSHSSLFPGVHKTSVIGKLPEGEAGAVLKLRVFVDQSVIECFADDAAILTARVYPSLDDSLGIRLQAGGEARIASLDIWEMRAAEIQ
ncbi:glycoside hydrolase family 32 protein [Cohnella sp. REN36]|uniref:glycoside hydrolase family 32 protein n=1 Tax=Cohnella sp. REN36 TaxID=2887347 RepID=UPI001D152723|nr:glycoside hydrolase family 32 protein [Cohnella sp. REN36]MCC3373717.1 glycoside hydrolase family 32 protein [Cohnella sp. REN36]